MAIIKGLRSEYKKKLIFLNLDVKKPIVNCNANFITENDNNQQRAQQQREIESLKHKLDEELSKNVRLNKELMQLKTSNLSFFLELAQFGILIFSLNKKGPNANTNDSRILNNDANNGESLTSSKRVKNHLKTNFSDEYSEIKYQIQLVENGIDDYFE